VRSIVRSIVIGADACNSVCGNGLAFPFRQCQGLGAVTGRMKDVELTGRRRFAG
jgi:hypothetical protein